MNNAANPAAVDLTIEITFSEGDLLDTLPTFSSFAAADEWFRARAVNIPRINYHSFNYRILLNGSEAYTGRVDVERDDATCSDILESSIRAGRDRFTRRFVDLLIALDLLSPSGR